jgi:hypothetical protein
MFAQTYWGYDSGSFDAYARGLIDDAGISIWPSLLRGLHSIGFYDRMGITLGLLALSFLVIPYLTARISSLSATLRGKKAFWGAFLLTATYPTLFFYSLDVYRDVFMVFCFLFALWPIKDFFESRKRFTWQNMARLILFFILCHFIFLLRNYLGFALFWAFFLCLFFSFSRHSVFFWSVVLVSGLWSLRAFGFLDPLIHYRTGFEVYMMNAGSNLRIPFDSVVLFPLDLAKSAIYQLFGFFFVNTASIAVFCLESVPFIYGIFYLFKNRRASNKFVDFLIAFFFLYNAIWLIGNDNLGTAVRLRLFSYIAVLISCLVVYQRKGMQQSSFPEGKRLSSKARQLSGSNSEKASAV